MLGAMGLMSRAYVRGDNMMQFEGKSPVSTGFGSSVLPTIDSSQRQRTECSS